MWMTFQKDEAEIQKMFEGQGVDLVGTEGSMQELWVR